jgi:hypothetical protein
MATQLLTRRHPERLQISPAVARGVETEDREGLSNVKRRILEAGAAVSAPRELIGGEEAHVRFESLSFEDGRRPGFARERGGVESGEGEEKAER